MSSVLRIADLRVDPALDEIYKDGVSLKLEPRAMRLLVCLAEHAGQVVSVDELLDLVWKDVVVSPDSVYTAVAALRRTLGDDPKQPRYIANVVRRGYRLIAPVSTWVDAPAEPVQTAATESVVGSEALTRGSSGPLSDAVEPAKQAPPAEPPNPWKVALWSAIAGLALLAIVAASMVAQDRWQRRHLATAQTPTAATSATSDASVAVLPFIDLSEKKDEEFFADGMSEELIDRLTKVTQLHIPARTSSFYFKGKQTPISDIARALGVSHVLEGSVRKSGDRLRITALLVRADTGFELWSETYDRKLDDIFKIQDDIAGAVVRALKVRLLEGQIPRAIPTANTEAYTLYLQAHAIRDRSNSPNNNQIATDYLKQAIKADPTFAPAWLELANNLSADYSTFGILPYQQTRDQAHDAADHALKLDPESSLAYVSMGRLLYELDWNWGAAEVAIKKAINLEPGNAEAYRMAGYIATTLGRFDEGIGLLKSAIALDPLQAWNYVATGFATYRAGDLTETERVDRKALDLNPTGGKIHYLLGTVLLLQNRPSDGLVEMQQETDPGYQHCGLALAFDALGRRTESNAELAIAEKTVAAEKAYWVALIYAARNDPDRAFAWLERAFHQRDDGLLWIKGEPLLRNIVADPRYKALMRQMNLPE